MNFLKVDIFSVSSLNAVLLDAITRSKSLLVTHQIKDFDLRLNALAQLLDILQGSDYSYPVSSFLDDFRYFLAFRALSR